jgi:hypothetical protein
VTDAVVGSRSDVPLNNDGVVRRLSGDVSGGLSPIL